MDIIFNIFNNFFRYFFYPFSNLDPALGMICISLVTSIIMLIIFRFTSNQQAIKKTKSIVHAYILEMRLYNHNLGKMSLALAKTLAANLSYLRHMITPLVFIIVPVLLVLVQTGYRYEYRPLHKGEHTIVKAVLKSDLSVLEYPVKLQVPEGITIETPRLKVPSLNEVDWRISGSKEGFYSLNFIFNGKQYKKNLHIGGTLPLLSNKRTGSDFYAFLLNHSEPELPNNSPFTSLQVIYPAKNLTILGFDLHWILWFLILSIVFSFGFKGLFKVEL